MMDFSGIFNLGIDISVSLCIMIIVSGYSDFVSAYIFESGGQMSVMI